MRGDELFRPGPPGPTGPGWAQRQAKARRWRRFDAWPLWGLAAWGIPVWLVASRWLGSGGWEALLLTVAAPVLVPALGLLGTAPRTILGARGFRDVPTAVGTAMLVSWWAGFLVPFFIAGATDGAPLASTANALAGGRLPANVEWISLLALVGVAAAAIVVAIVAAGALRAPGPSDRASGIAPAAASAAPEAAPALVPASVPGAGSGAVGSHLVDPRAIEADRAAERAESAARTVWASSSAVSAAARRSAPPIGASAVETPARRRGLTPRILSLAAAAILPPVLVIAGAAIGTGIVQAQPDAAGESWPVASARPIEEQLALADERYASFQASVAPVRERIALDGWTYSQGPLSGSAHRCGVERLDCYGFALDQRVAAEDLVPGLELASVEPLLVSAGWTVERSSAQAIVASRPDGATLEVRRIQSSGDCLLEVSSPRWYGDERALLDARHPRVPGAELVYRFDERHRFDAWPGW